MWFGYLLFLDVDLYPTVCGVQNGLCVQLTGVPAWGWEHKT